MGNNNYIPFDNILPKPTWDSSLSAKHDIVGYLQHLHIIVNCWWIEKFFNTQEFADAALELHTLKESMKN